MSPIKRIVLDTIDKNIGFIKGMEIDPVGDMFEVTLNGKLIGTFTQKEFEDQIMAMPFINALKLLK